MPDNAVPPLNLLHIIQIIQHRPIPHFHALRADEDAMLQRRLLAPVARPLDTAVVLPHRLVEVNANPWPRAAWDRGHLPHILDDAAPRVIAANAAPTASGDAALLNVAFERFNLGLLMARGVGVEAAQLLSLLPGKDRVCLLLVLLNREDKLFDARVIKVGLSVDGARVHDLGLRVSGKMSGCLCSGWAGTKDDWVGGGNVFGTKRHHPSMCAMSHRSVIASVGGGSALPNLDSLIWIDMRHFFHG
ncbi:hypothetical protein VDGD_20696 [Verticillium dahliae]|nr:hypothetical protein VDGD_20696 [Verticillium dahliae]